MRRWIFALLPLAVACGEETEVTFSPFRVEELGSTRALIRFTTSIPTSCVIEYGLEPAALTKTATDPDMRPGETRSDHEVPIEDLTPSTTYHFRAKVTDEDERIFYSQLSSFTTLTSTKTEQGRNVALLAAGARVAMVSSNWANAPNDGSFGANHAIDGLMATEWSTNGDGDDAFIVLELGAEASVNRIAFRSREMTDGTSIVRKIRVEPEGGAPLGPFDTPEPSVRYVFDLTSPVRAQRWKISAVETTGGNTGAREIELWSSEAP
jgi:hypothetical protein